MPLYMYQAAYTAESWSAQMKNPQNRVESVGRQVTEAGGGEMIGGWYCLAHCDDGGADRRDDGADRGGDGDGGRNQVQPYHCIDDRGETCGAGEEVGVRR